MLFSQGFNLDCLEAGGRGEWRWGVKGGKGAYGGLRFCCLFASQRDFLFLNEVVIKGLNVFFFSCVSGFLRPGGAWRERLQKFSLSLIYRVISPSTFWILARCRSGGENGQFEPQLSWWTPRGHVINTLCELGEAESPKFLTMSMLKWRNKGYTREPCDNCWGSISDCGFLFWTNRYHPITFKGPVCKKFLRESVWHGVLYPGHCQDLCTNGS